MVGGWQRIAESELGREGLVASVVLLTPGTWLVTFTSQQLEPQAKCGDADHAWPEASV